MMKPFVGISKTAGLRYSLFLPITMYPKMGGVCMNVQITLKLASQDQLRRESTASAPAQSLLCKSHSKNK